MYLYRRRRWPLPRRRQPRVSLSHSLLLLSPRCYNAAGGISGGAAVWQRLIIGDFAYCVEDARRHVVGIYICTYVMYVYRTTGRPVEVGGCIIASVYIYTVPARHLFYRRARVLASEYIKTPPRVLGAILGVIVFERGGVGGGWYSSGGVYIVWLRGE